MAHWTEDLHELCEKITDEIAKANKKLKNAGGDMTAGDIEYIDKLTHALKSIKSVLMAEEYGNEYSGNYPYYMRNTYARNDGTRTNTSGNSYARGRRDNVRRDSMGRYSREGGYSYDEAMDEMATAIREGMSEMPEELKRDAQRLLNKIESM